MSNFQKSLYEKQAKRQWKAGHMLEAADSTFEFIEGKSFETHRQDKLLRIRVIKNLEITGEVANLLTKDFRSDHRAVEWRDIIGMRHILVGSYRQIWDEIVWAAIEPYLKPLQHKLKEFLLE